MSKWTLGLGAVLALYGLSACNNSSAPTPDANAPAFSYTIEEDSAGFSGLPALQSFAFASSEDGSEWLLFGGRTNGFHGFGTDEGFPMKMANQYIYVYHTGTKKLDSMNVAALPSDLRRPFSSTNMQVRQLDSMLYVCGGYGQVDTAQKITSWITHPYIARVHVRRMIAAVKAADTLALRRSIAWHKSEVVRATGGELFKLADGRFYLAVGHDFEGLYGSDSTMHSQKYLDEVRVFRLLETDSTIEVRDFTTISDGLPDSTTQFRRRDLVVAPAVLAGGSSFGISVYGGVFTPAGNAFHFPIHITGDGGKPYTIDWNFFQATNIYSAPNIELYDPTRQRMYTTIFGGIGEPKIDTVGGADSATFTRAILNINRDYASKKTTSWLDGAKMPAYVGSEGIFIRAKGAPAYQGNKFDIIDFAALQKGRQLVGHIYGGILSNAPQWNGPSNPPLPPNPTRASNRVYRVYLTKS